jgi:hypothetical protein
MCMLFEMSTTCVGRCRYKAVRISTSKTQGPNIDCLSSRAVSTHRRLQAYHAKVARCISMQVSQQKFVELGCLCACRVKGHARAGSFCS